MPIRIIHTADNHIGMTFNNRGYSAEVRAALVKERFDALERIVSLTNSSKADLLVIAGDLFDKTSMARQDIKTVAAILNRVEEAWLLVLPGNHDYFEAGKDNLWDVFQRNMEYDRFILLDRQEPKELFINEQKVMVYPCPCRSKHSEANMIGWVKDEPKDKEAVNVGIAHGSVEGFSADFNQKYFPMTKSELAQSGVDFWLLGHTHIRYPAKEQEQNPGFFFPATPTPDGFDRSHEGYVWQLDIDEQKKIRMQSIQTGEYRFYDNEETVKDLDDIEKIKRKYTSLGQRAMVKLKISGTLTEEDRQALQTTIGEIANQIGYLEPEENIRLHITPEQIGRDYKPGSLPYRLLSNLSVAAEDNLALQMANEMIQKLRK
jgi:DNA repair exonuclease SbcCD nuclease subunit